MECWYLWDTHGETAPCREPDKLQKAIRGKQSWNLQIKTWAEAMNDALVLPQDELAEYCNGLPGWIFEATIRQAGKIHMKRSGWIPRFLRLERVLGNWWPPQMDWFDPEI